MAVGVQFVHLQPWKPTTLDADIQRDDNTLAQFHIQSQTPSLQGLLLCKCQVHTDTTQ